MHFLLLFVLGVFALAVVLRVEFFFYVLYLFFGLYLLGQTWVRRGIRQVVHRRRYVDRAFFEEEIPVEVEVWNNGWLPLPWLRVDDSLPIELHTPPFARRVVSLLPHERVTLAYTLIGRHRGYYHIGPLHLALGDPFGVHEVSTFEEEVASDGLVVYPKILPLRDLGLPSQMPQGTLVTKQRIFEDPTRITGVRDYQAGDSLKRINWRTSAAVGRLQVKRYQPAISIETSIFLNLDEEDYSLRHRRQATELGITVAASIAVHLGERRQAVGLSTNGVDPKTDEVRPISIRLRRGRAHVLQILDILARIRVAQGVSFMTLLQQQSIDLPWGCTAFVVTSTETADLLPSLLLLERRGFNVVLILVDPQTPFRSTKLRAERIGIEVYRVTQERDLDVWR